MALSIKNDTADELARELAEITGESLTDAVINSLRERLERQRAMKPRENLVESLMDIGRRCARRPLLDARAPDQILYDEDGLPK